MTGTAARIRRLRAIRRQRRWPPFTLSLTASIIGFALLLPVIYLLIRTLDAGAESLADILLRPRTAAIILRSVVLVAIVSGASAILALSLGWLIERTDLPFRRAWSILTVLPLVMPSYIVAFLFISVFAPLGILHRLVTEPLGIEKLPSVYGLPGAAIVLVLVSYPYTLLTVRAALRGSGRALEDASRTLGKGPWETFLRVTLPQLRPALASGSLLVALYTISDFGAVSLLRYETFTWAIYLQYTSYVDRTAAAALSLVLVGLAVLLFLVETSAHGDRPLEDTHQAELGGADSPSVPLGVWKYPALALCSLVALVALVIPMAVLLFWLIRGARRGRALERGVGTGAQFRYRIVSCGSGSGRHSVAHRCPRRAIPRAVQHVHRPDQPRGVRPARHRHRARVGFLRLPSCAKPVSDACDADIRLRHPVPAGCDGAGAGVPAASESGCGGGGSNSGTPPSSRVSYNNSAAVAPRHPGRRGARFSNRNEGASCNLATESTRFQQPRHDDLGRKL